MRVVVEQGRLPGYRLPFFEALGRRIESLRVVHSGPPASSAGAAFEEVVLPLRTAGGVYWQPGLGDVVRGANVFVAMFDLRWPMNLFETVVSRRASRHLLWGHGLGRRRGLWPLRLAWARRADGVILYHRAQADRLIELGLPAGRVFVAPNAVELPSSVRTGGRRDSVLFVGRLQPRKRIDVLIDAFAGLVADGAHPDLRLDLVGDGSERGSLEQQAERRGVADRVYFHGSVFEKARLAELFGRAIVYASPGWTGLGLLHAFGHGVPAVIGDGIDHPPEAQDLVPGVNGLRAEPDPESFGRALQRLVSDPELRDRLGEAAAGFVHTRRRIDDMVNGFVEALGDPVGPSGESK